MKIEISDELYDVFVKLVEFMDSDGFPDNVQPIDPKTIVGWIEHGAEMYIVDYLNSCHDTWEQNEMFKDLEAAYDKYNKPFCG